MYVAETIADVEAHELLSFVDSWVAVEAWTRRTSSYDRTRKIGVGRLQAVTTDTDGSSYVLKFVFANGDSVQYGMGCTDFTIHLANETF